MAFLGKMAVDLTGNQAHLRLLATTDLHMHILSYDYFADRPSDLPGLARAARLVGQLRGSSANSLLVDAGDFLQGTPMADYFGVEAGLPDGAVHPMIAAMNALGYDAATLGNHEFSYGLEFLERAISDADFPLVSANLVTSKGDLPTDDRTFIAPYALLDRKLTTGGMAAIPIRIGVIGFAPPQVATWEQAHLGGRIKGRDIVETAEAWVPEMRARGADLVIALAHTGIGANRHEPGMENAALPLARVDGIDILVLGHSHLVFPDRLFAGRAGVDAVAGRLHDRPAVMPGRWGAHLGVIDLVLERRGATWHMAGSGARTIDVVAEMVARPAPSGSTCPIDRVAAPAHAATRAHVRRPVGSATRPLHTYFAQIADCNALRLVASAKRAWARKKLRDTDLADLPVLATATPFRSGGRGGPGNYTDIPAGPLELRHAHDLYAFPNTLRLLHISGAELRAMLERVAGLFAQVVPGARDVPLLLPDAPGYNFDLIDGVSYEIDLSRPARFTVQGHIADPEGARIRALSHAGKKVRPDDRFLLVTNNFRASGGGGFPAMKRENLVIECREPIRHVLSRHIRDLGSVGTEGVGSWRLHAPSGTSVRFDTGPRAGPHLDEIAHLRPEPLGRSDTGFLRLRLHL